MKTRMKTRILFAVALLGTMLGAASQPAQAAPSRATDCLPNQLTIAPISSQGAMGHLALQFRIRNHSKATCWLYGYPGAQLLDVHRHPLHTALRWGGSYMASTHPKQTVWLAPGGSAYFILDWVHIPTGKEACPMAPYLLVTPPNAFSSLLVSIKPGGIDACGGRLNATPVAPAPFQGF